jgi:hypothetical protein
VRASAAVPRSFWASTSRADSRSAAAPATAVVRRPGQPDRALPLPRRELSDLLAEELRRLDADETYGEALQATTGTTGLSLRSGRRVHEWRDPATSGS